MNVGSCSLGVEADQDRQTNQMVAQDTLRLSRIRRPNTDYWASMIEATYISNFSLRHVSTDASLRHSGFIPGKRQSEAY